MKNSVGEQIKTIRKKHGLTISNMVDVLGMNRSNYSQMENAKSNYTIDSLIKVCEALNVSIKIEEQKEGQNQ